MFLLGGFIRPNAGNTSNSRLPHFDGRSTTTDVKAKRHSLWRRTCMKLIFAQAQSLGKPFTRGTHELELDIHSVFLPVSDRCLWIRHTCVVATVVMWAFVRVLCDHGEEVRSQRSAALTQPHTRRFLEYIRETRQAPRAGRRSAFD